jgi:hypothetical protein
MILGIVRSNDRLRVWGVTNGIRADPRGFMDTYESVEKDTVACGSETWVRMHDAVGPQGGTWYNTYAANWMYGTHMPVLDVRTWLRGDVPSLGLTDEDVGLLRGWIVISWLKV